MSQLDRRRQPAGAAVLQKTVTAAISVAVFDELAEVGYARLSMEAVARRAGVGKAAIYRRWSGKETMVIDLIAEVMRKHGLILPETGTLAGDIEMYLRATRDQLGHPLIARIVPDMFGEVARNSSLADALREATATPRRETGKVMLRSAVDRGELPADLDYDLAFDLLIAPLSFHLLLIDATVDNDYVHRLAIATVAALKTATRRTGDGNKPAAP